VINDQIAKHESFSSYFIRDHDLILKKHPEKYITVDITNIFHIDDTPESVKSFGEKQCYLFNFDRKNLDKQQLFDKVHEEILKFVY
jgi:hypothetical protein